MVKGKKIACPSCARKFASSAAMQQHKAAAHGGSNKPPNANVARRRNGPPRSFSMPVTTLSGSDIVATTVVLAGGTAGRALLCVRINPRALEGTRLAQLSECWARWRPSNLRFRVSCAGASTTFGTVLVGWTPDTIATFIGASRANLSRVSTCRPNAEIRLSSSAALNIPVESSRKWYLTSGVPDDTTHGSFLVVIGAVTGGYSGYVSVTVHLDWVVGFEGVDLESDHADDDLLRPDAGWDHLFTTSDGSFDASVLTFKMHHGGDMVAWSAAHPARVYTLAGTTKVPYYNQAGQLLYCQYFAAVQGYKIPGMLLFATSEDADAYIKTGVVSKALPYYKSCGEEVTPSTPVLKLVTSSVAGMDPDVSILLKEVETLRLQVAKLSQPDTTVVDEMAASVLSRIYEKVGGMPSGTAADPTKVFVVDPTVSNEDLRDGLDKKAEELRGRVAGGLGSSHMSWPRPSTGKGMPYRPKADDH